MTTSNQPPFNVGDRLRVEDAGDSPFARGEVVHVIGIPSASRIQVDTMGLHQAFRTNRFSLLVAAPKASPRIIGLTGLKRSGKDTAAKALIDKGYTKASFAEPIKLMLAALLAYRGANPDQIEQMLEGDLKETPTPLLNGQSPRYAMQTLGTEWGRELIADGVWLDALSDNIKGKAKVVITDVRFDNEADFVNTRGGSVVRVTRRGQDAPANHPSETAILNMEVDAEILNNAPSAQAFTAKVSQLLG